LYCEIFPANAPLPADVTLLLELAMGVALLFGAWLARRRQYKGHACCQSLVVLLNLVVIAMAMVPSLHAQVLPKIPAKLNRSFYAIATAHALVASIAEAAALYILLAAGTKSLPEQWRIANFKLAMRSVLAVWWLALFLGIATYIRWYIRL
jgi:Ca2+/H+ antiporter